MSTLSANFPRASRGWSWKFSVSESNSKKASAWGPPEVIILISCGSRFLNGKYNLKPSGKWVRTHGGKTYEIFSNVAVIEENGTGIEVDQQAWFISRTDEGVEYNLDYYWASMDTDNHSAPPKTGWNVLVGQNPPPKLNFDFLFKLEDPCLVLPEKKNDKVKYGRVVERLTGGYVVEISDSTIATYVPLNRLKSYSAPPLAVGNIVETKIKSGRWRNMWIQCQVTAAKPNQLYDLHVLDWRKYNVCAYAKDVPRKLLRELETEDKRSKPKFEVGKYIETQIISGQHAGKWVGAMITNVYMDKTYDIKVLSPGQYKVSSRAVSVPERFIREHKMS